MKINRYKPIQTLQKQDNWRTFRRSQSYEHQQIDAKFNLCTHVNLNRKTYCSLNYSFFLIVGVWPAIRVHRRK